MGKFCLFSGTRSNFQQEYWQGEGPMKVSFLAQLAHNLLHFPWTLGTYAVCSFKVLFSPFGHPQHHFYNYFQSTLWSRSFKMRHDSSQKCPDHLTCIFHVNGEDLYSAWDKSWKMLLAMVSESLLESIKLSNGASQTLCTPGETLCLWHGLLQEHISLILITLGLWWRAGGCTNVDSQQSQDGYLETFWQKLGL